jgi:hypothetical protein
MVNHDADREALKAAAEAKNAAEHSYLKTKAHAERVKAASTLIERLDEYQDAPVVIAQAAQIAAILPVPPKTSSKVPNGPVIVRGTPTIKPLGHTTGSMRGDS